MQNITLKQLSPDMGKPEYDMLQSIPDVENGFTNPAHNLSYLRWCEKAKSLLLKKGFLPS